MGALMKILLILLFFSFSSCTSIKFIRPLNKDIKDGGRLLFGPETFPFCGGDVEMWVQLDWRWKLKLKISPPEGKNWKVTNANIIIENPAVENGLIYLSSDTEIEWPSRNDSNVGEWYLNQFTSDQSDIDAVKKAGIKVALRPFDGCDTEQGTEGRILRLTN